MKENIPFARALRRQQTPVEKLLWKKLKNRQLCDYKFRRQVSIGSYIVDFFSREANLIIELDGGIHALQVAYDRGREKFLKQRGHRVLRFENHELKEGIDVVIEVIVKYLRTPHLNPLPRGEEV